MVDDAPETNVDAIWEGDLLGRKDEATALIGFLESTFAARSGGNDASFTMSIDARYGHGKTFFLKRLARQLKINHPVAFVDAWADDLANEPLIALIATLKKALKPYLKPSTVVASKWETVLSKTGTVAKIVAKGLAKKGASLIITSAGAEAVEQVMTGMSDDKVDALKAKLENASEDAVDGASSVFSGENSQGLMERRLAEFEEGQQAIADLKASLRELIDALENEDKSAPILIILDELDRCRPTYAIKLLEEIKHLFDVSGLVFIFGMHGEQLAHSIQAEYGPSFDGPAYLRRFIQRRYSLAEPDLEPFIASLIKSTGLNTSRIAQPPFLENGARNRKTSAAFIASYMTAYKLTARDAYELIDILNTATAIANSQLIGPYLLPLAIGQVKRLPMGQLPEIVDEPEWRLLFDRQRAEPEDVKAGDAAQRYFDAAQMSREEMIAAYEADDPIRCSVARQRNDWGAFELDTVPNYPKLLSMVRRLT